MEALKLTGRYFVSVYGPDGRLKEEAATDNVVVTHGKEFIASFLKSAALAAATNTAKYLAVGTGTGAESVSDTALGTELARHTGTVSYTSGGIYNVVATFPTGAAVGAVIEFGLLSSASAGTLLSRTVRSQAVNIGALDYVVVNYQMTFS
jgi:hypothetical protein